MACSETRTAFDRTLIFEHCSTTGKGLEFRYSLDEPDAKLPDVHVELACLVAKTGLEVHLGMAMIPYLWMLRPSKRVHVRAGLAPSALVFWRQVYRGVLAEFFLTNRMEAFEIFLTTSDSDVSAAVDEPDLEDKVLVPLGAGKDSIVCFALLRESYMASKLRWFYVGRQIGEYSACDRYQRIATQESSLPLVQEGMAVAPDEWSQGYNAVGHPFACFVLFSSVLHAASHGFKYVCLGNERSANYDDVPGVNHQWDKSALFTRMAQAYLHEYTGVRVFSAIQQWWELQIVALFCRMPSTAPYWNLFLSCNMPLEEEHWCGHCEKCLFMALCLQSFESPRRVQEVWRGADVLQNTELLPKLCEMLGQRKKSPPFDCVGTEEETRMAAALCVRRCRREEARLPYLLRKCGAVSWKAPEPRALLTELVEADVPEWLQPAIARANGLLANVAESL